MASTLDFIRRLEARGRCAFTTEEAVAALGISVVAVRSALRRLKKKGRIADPYRGFHVLVPPSYRDQGCLPAEEFLPQLMRCLGVPYYVALLSAAYYHGAAAEPAALQVMVPTSRRCIRCGEVQVNFVARHDMACSSVTAYDTDTGSLQIASPEATAIELVGYVGRCYSLDLVTTILARENLRGDLLAKEASQAPQAWVQRLGYLLSLIKAHELADHVESVLATRETFPVPLSPGIEMTGAPRDHRWNIVVNVDVEPDL